MRAPRCLPGQILPWFDYQRTAQIHASAQSREPQRLDYVQTGLARLEQLSSRRELASDLVTPINSACLAPPSPHLLVGRRSILIQRSSGTRSRPAVSTTSRNRVSSSSATSSTGTGG